MMAALLTELPAVTLQLADLADPAAAPGEVIVSVSACGICGTDLHVMAGESYRPDLPFVLGHELVGTVVSAAGPAAAPWVGRRVVPTLFIGCGSCSACGAGDERLCRARCHGRGRRRPARRLCQPRRSAGRPARGSPGSDHRRHRRQPG